MNDNIELQSTAGRLLAWVPAITPPFPLVEPLIQQLITILQDSTVSPLLITLTNSSPGAQRCTASLS